MILRQVYHFKRRVVCRQPDGLAAPVVRSAQDVELHSTFVSQCAHTPQCLTTVQILSRVDSRTFPSSFIFWAHYSAAAFEHTCVALAYACERWRPTMASKSTWLRLWDHIWSVICASSCVMATTKVMMPIMVSVLSISISTAHPLFLPLYCFLTLRTCSTSSTSCLFLSRILSNLFCIWTFSQLDWVRVVLLSACLSLSQKFCRHWKACFASILPW